MKKIKGDIGFYSLEDWWIDAFSEEERKYILSIYRPMGGNDESLIEGERKRENFIVEPHSIVQFLATLASWFHRKDDRHIARKILDKALILVDENTKVLDLHFMYQHIIQIYYKDRNVPEYFDKAIWACKKQIELSKKSANEFIRDPYNKDGSLPRHIGYEQLAIILEKEKKYDEAIRLCEQAKNEGWNGDWDKRIGRCKKKKVNRAF